MSPTVKDILGFVVNPPPGDPTRTAGSDLLPNGAVIAAGAGPTAGLIPISDGVGGYTWQTLPWLAPVTSLPASPVDGQECYYVADAANGIVWHLKYRTADPTAHKWQFVGGPDMVSTASGSLTTPSSSYVALTGGPSITAPLPGDYEVFTSCLCSLGAASFTQMNAIPAKNGTPLAGATAGSLNAPTQNMGGELPMVNLAPNLVAGDAITVMVSNSAAVSCIFSQGWVNLAPRRLG